VDSIVESDVDVMLKKKDGCWLFLRLHPAHVRKLNKFSLHETIRIKNDRETIQRIQHFFGDKFEHSVKVNYEFFNN